MPLIDSDTWDDKFIPLNQLRFHPANPRLPELPPTASEAEIILEMCTRCNVEAIARSIAEKGYFRQDRLIVLKEDGGRHTVYEGNRRLCALKVLSNPDLAPPNMHRAFRRLAEKAKLPKKVAVEIVSSKFDAEVVMYAKHAGELFTVGWQPVQQATFIAAKLDQGDSIDDVCKTYDLGRERVIEARNAVDVYRMARCAQLSDRAKQLVDDPEKFPYSTVFDRLFKPKKSREALGATFMEKGLVVNSTKEKFLPLLAKMLDDAAGGQIDTRKLNKEPQQLAYVKKLGFTPGGGTLTAESLETGKKAEEKTAVATRAAENKAQRRSAKASGRVFPRELTSQLSHLKLDELLKEGKKLNIEGAEYSATFLLRATLEIALGVRLRHMRLWHEVRKFEKNAALGPTLAVTLDYVNKNRDRFNFDPATVHALEALVSRSIKQSKAEIDRIVHSPDVTATTDNVIHIRQLVVALLHELLRHTK